MERKFACPIVDCSATCDTLHFYLKHIRDYHESARSIRCNLGHCAGSVSNKTFETLKSFHNHVYSYHPLATRSEGMLLDLLKGILLCDRLT